MGLPIITQQAAEQVFSDLGIDDIQKSEFESNIAPKITPNVIHTALFNVADTKYAQLKVYYSLLVTGARKRARKYNTYELVLASFGVEPLKFSLIRYEIEERIRNSQSQALPKTAISICGFHAEGARRAAAKARNSTIGVGGPENKHCIYWNQRFCFYIRWREPRKTTTYQVNYFRRVCKDCYPRKIVWKIGVVCSWETPSSSENREAS